VPTHRPLIASSAREGNAAATISIAIDLNTAPVVGIS
jgi:hypothetical protein